MNDEQMRLAIASMEKFTADLQQILAKSREHLNTSIDDMDPNTRGRAEDLCRTYEFSDSVRLEVMSCVLCLIEFELQLKAQIATPSEKRRDLERVVSLAGELAVLLKKVEQPRLDYLAERLNRRLLQTAIATGAVAGGADVASVAVEMLRSDDLERLAIDVRQLIEELPTDGKKGGRRPVLHGYAEQVQLLWLAVRGTGMKAGRGGEFERFCNSVFSIAGIPSSAEGAVRHFVKEMLPHLQRLQELEPLESLRESFSTGANHADNSPEKSTTQSAKVIPLRG